MSYQRRSYRIESPDFAERRVEIVMLVDGKQVVRLQARQPGLVAYVARPDGAGYDFELVERVGERVVDLAPFEETDPPVSPEQPLAWQRQALEGPS